MLREALILLALAALPVESPPARVEPGETLEFRFQDPAIVESSGLAVVDGLVVTVNDSGDEPRVFTVDPATGQTVGVTRWAGEATDVEALAPAGDGEVWVADIGDNDAERDTVTVLRVPVGPGERYVEAPAYRLRYPGGPRDAEALLAHPETGRLLVVTKGVLGGEAFLAPLTLATGGENRLRSLGSVMPLVTGGEFLPDGRHLVLRDYSRAVVHTWPGLEEVGELVLPQQQQGEAITVTDDGRFLVSTEGPRSPVHSVEPTQQLREALSPAPSTTGPDVAEPGSAPLGTERDGGADWLRWLRFGLLAAAAVILFRALRRR